MRKRKRNRIKRLRHSVKHALFERRNDSLVRYFCLEGQLATDTRLRRGQHLGVALFVHASVLHLFGNMLFLFVFGSTLEKTVGPRKLMLIFFTGGFTSF